MKVKLEVGDVLYAVEDLSSDSISLCKATIEDVMEKQVRFVDGDSLFKLMRLSKHDPRVSTDKRKAIGAYIIRKRRQIRELRERISERNDQLKTAKRLLLEVAK